MKTLPLLATACAVLLACDSGDDAKPSAPKHTQAEFDARADEIYAAFRQWHDNLPATDAPAKTCDDAEIAKFETEKNRITFLAYQSLRYALGEPWDGNNSLVGFMTNSKVRYPPRQEFVYKKQSNVKKAMRMWNFVEYVGVVVPIDERKVEALSPNLGRGGALKAQLVIYRPGEPDPLCHTPFEVASSGTVQYRHELGANSSDKKSKAAYALKKQMCREISTVVKAKVGALTKALEPDFIDCNGV